MDMENLKYYQNAIDELNNLGYLNQPAAGKRAEEIMKHAEDNNHLEFVYFFKGEQLFYSGEFEKAAQYELKALESRDDVVFFHSNFAVILTIQGKYQDALRYYNQALALRPNDAHALCCKSVALSRMSLRDEAMNEIEKVLANVSDDNPYYWQACFNKAILLSNLGKKVEAISFFDKALVIKPDNPNILNKKGLLLLNVGKKESALELFNRAIELNPQNKYALRNKAIVLNRLGKPKESLLCFNIIRTFCELEDFDYAWLAKINKQLERFDEAIEAAEHWLVDLRNFELPTKDAEAFLSELKEKKQEKK